MSFPFLGGQKLSSPVADNRELHNYVNFTPDFGKLRMVSPELCGPGTLTPPPRQVPFLGANEVASMTRVSTEQEWERLSKKLDQRMRQLLADA